MGRFRCFGWGDKCSAVCMVQCARSSRRTERSGRRRAPTGSVGARVGGRARAAAGACGHLVPRVRTTASRGLVSGVLLGGGPWSAQRTLTKKQEGQTQPSNSRRISTPGASSFATADAAAAVPPCAERSGRGGRPARCASTVSVPVVGSGAGGRAALEALAVTRLQPAVVKGEAGGSMASNLGGEARSDRAAARCGRRGCGARVGAPAD